MVVDAARPIEKGLDLGVLVSRAEQRSLLPIERCDVAVVSEQLMPDKQRGAERAPGVAGGRLNPESA